MLLGAYAPQSGRPRSEKTAFYTALTKATKRNSKKGPYWILGEFNARVQEADEDIEAYIVRQHKFANGQPKT